MSCLIITGPLADGNFKMFQQKPIVKEIQKDMVELIREYFEKYETVTATVHENFAVKK